MKLLLDQNLSRRLLPVLEPYFVGSTHVALLGMDTAEDIQIWNFAREAAFAIVTKDADFVELSLMRGWPPKIIHLDLGNVVNACITECLLKHHDLIADFLLTDHGGVLKIE